MLDSCNFLDMISSGYLINEKYKVMIIAPHQDDEVIGAGSLFNKIKNIFFIHVTDGAPIGYEYQSSTGSLTGMAYSALRFGEFSESLRVSGTVPKYHIKMGYKDQSLVYNLVQLTSRFISIFNYINPDLILVNPFEGGHPDHDSTSLAVNQAANILKSKGQKINIVEYASYFNNNGLIQTGEFLTGDKSVCKLLLNDEQQSVKKTMYDCFASQKETISCFHTLHECYREAPGYDFTNPPGETYYDMFNWGVDSKTWFRNAKNALLEIKRDSSNEYS